MDRKRRRTANLGGSVARFDSMQKPKPTPITELAESRNRNRNRTTDTSVWFGSVYGFGLKSAQADVLLQLRSTGETNLGSPKSISVGF